MKREKKNSLIGYLVLDQYPVRVISVLRIYSDNFVGLDNMNNTDEVLENWSSFFSSLIWPSSMYNNDDLLWFPYVPRVSLG